MIAPGIRLGSSYFGLGLIQSVISRIKLPSNAVRAFVAVDQTDGLGLSEPSSNLADYQCIGQETVIVQSQDCCHKLFVCGHKPKTKELLELLLFFLLFTIWFIPL